MPPKHKAAVQSAIDDNDDTLLHATRKIQGRIDKVYNDFIKSYTSYVSTQRDIDLVKAATITGKAYELAEEAGLTRVVQDYANEFANLHKVSLKYYNALGLPAALTEANNKLLETSIARSVEYMQDTMTTDLLNGLERVLYEGVLGSQEASQIIETQVAIATQLSPADVSSEVDRIYHVFTQQVKNLKAEELKLDIYIYAGPYDGKTSPECASILTGRKSLGVEGMYVRGEIRQGMSAEVTTPTIFLTGGHHGYNCRHAFYPITVEYARQLGAKIDAKNKN